LRPALESVYDRRAGIQVHNQKPSAKRGGGVKNDLMSKGIEVLGVGKTVAANFCPKSKNRRESIACPAPKRRVIVFIKGAAT